MDGYGWINATSSNNDFLAVAAVSILLTSSSEHAYIQIVRSGTYIQKIISIDDIDVEMYGKEN
jgi:hypothetical protein